MRKFTKIHLFPTGRLGNQLYFAVAAITLKKKLSAQGVSPKVILHAAQPLGDLKYLINFEPEKIERDTLLRMIVGKRTLQKANIIIRFLYKLLQLRYKLIGQEIVVYGDLDAINCRDSIKISESRHDYRFFEDNKEEILQYQQTHLKSLFDLAGITTEKIESNIAIHMRFGDYLLPDIATQYGNLS